MSPRMSVRLRRIPEVQRGLRRCESFYGIFRVVICWPGLICEATPMSHGPGMGFCKPDAVASGSDQSHGPLRICADPQCAVTRLMLSPHHFSRRFARMLDSPSMKFIFSYSFGPTRDVLSPTSGTPRPTRDSSLSHVCGPSRKGVPLAVSSQHSHEEINR